MTSKQITIINNSGGGAFIKDFILQFLFDSAHLQYYGDKESADSHQQLPITQTYESAIKNFDGFEDKHIYNHIIVNGFNTGLSEEINNSKSSKQKRTYKRRTKLEDTLPMYVHMYGIGVVSYFQNLSYSLRSKKNNRPIHIKWGALKGGGAYKLANAVKSRNNKAIAGAIMSSVFLGKDDDLRQQEELLRQYFNLHKGMQYMVTIPDFYSTKELQKKLIKLYDMGEGLLKEEFMSDEGTRELLLKKALHIIEKYNLKDLTLYFDGYAIQEQFVEQLGAFCTEHNLKADIGVADGKSHFTDIFETYMDNFVYFEEKLRGIMKTRNFGLTESYKQESFENDNIAVIDVLHLLSSKAMKFYIKRIYTLFNQQYKELALNSFLTQPDLSNSLELIQDVYQKYLQTIGIDWDDKFITEIAGHIIRYKKADKKEMLYKNIALFGLEKKL